MPFYSVTFVCSFMWMHVRRSMSVSIKDTHVTKKKFQREDIFKSHLHSMIKFFSVNRDQLAFSPNNIFLI